MNSLYRKYYRGKISFWNTVKTEWDAIKNDKAVISTFIAFAFLLIVVYTYVYSNEIVKEVPVAVINEDASKMSRDYISMLNSSEGIIVSDSYTDLQQAKNDFYAKKVYGIVIIPKNFGKDLRRNRQVTISTFSDASNMIFYKKVLGQVTITTGYFNAGIAINKEMAKGNPISLAQANYTPIQTISTSLFNTSSGYATYIIPILTALIVQLVLLIGIGIINGTRKEDNKMYAKFPGLLHRGGTIPVLLGKSFVYALLFAVILPIQIGIVYTLFSIPIRTSLWNIYLFAIPYLLSVVFLGIGISSLFKRREEAIIFLVLLSIPSLMLSGLSFPMESFSQFYQNLAQIIPSTPGINGFVKLTQLEASFQEVSTEWIQLWILTFLYFILAAISLKIQAIKEKQYLIIKTS